MSEVKEVVEVVEVGSPEFVTFVGWYMSMGEVQQTVGKDGLIIKTGEVTKVKNGIVFYILEGETGERKCSEKFIDKVRDFGTSIYGVFYSTIDKNIAIDAIIEKLEERVLGCMQAKASLICEMEDRK